MNLKRSNRSAKYQPNLFSFEGVIQKIIYRNGTCVSFTAYHYIHATLKFVFLSLEIMSVTWHILLFADVIKVFLLPFI